MTPFAWFCLGMPVGALFVLLCVVFANGIPKYQQGGMIDGSDGDPVVAMPGWMGCATCNIRIENAGDMASTLKILARHECDDWHHAFVQPPKDAPPPKTGTA